MEIIENEFYVVCITQSTESSLSLSLRLQKKARKRQNRVSFVAVKATGESSESSSSLSIVKSVQSAWDKSEDRLAFVGLGFAAVVALWASTNLITWFIYRYLLFKPDREELIQIINKAISEILDQ